MDHSAILSQDVRLWSTAVKARSAWVGGWRKESWSFAWRNMDSGVEYLPYTTMELASERSTYKKRWLMRTMYIESC